MNLRWVGTLDRQDQEQMYADLLAAVEAARVHHDAGLVERCLSEWQATADALVNGSLREQLLDDGA